MEDNTDKVKKRNKLEKILAHNQEGPSELLNVDQDSSSSFRQPSPRDSLSFPDLIGSPWSREGHICTLFFVIFGSISSILELLAVCING